MTPIGEEELNRNMMGTFPETNNKFKMKESTVLLAEEKLQKLCERAEESMKKLEEIKSNKYNLENHLKRAEYRLHEHCKTERDCETDLLRAKKNVEKIEHLIKEEEDIQRDEEEAFDQDVHALSDTICEGRDIFCDEVIEREINELCDTNSVMMEEMMNIQKDLDEIKANLLFILPSSPDMMIKYLEENRYNIKKEVEKMNGRAVTLNEDRMSLQRTRQNLQKELADLKIQHNFG